MKTHHLSSFYMQKFGKNIFRVSVIRTLHPFFRLCLDTWQLWKVRLCCTAAQRGGVGDLLDLLSARILFMVNLRSKGNKPHQCHPSLQEILFQRDGNLPEAVGIFGAAAPPKFPPWMCCEGKMWGMRVASILGLLSPASPPRYQGFMVFHGFLGSTCVTFNRTPVRFTNQWGELLIWDNPAGTLVWLTKLTLNWRSKHFC